MKFFGVWLLSLSYNWKYFVHFGSWFNLSAWGSVKGLFSGDLAGATVTMWGLLLQLTDMCRLITEASWLELLFQSFWVILWKKITLQKAALIIWKNSGQDETLHFRTARSNVYIQCKHHEKPQEISQILENNLSKWIWQWSSVNVWPLVGVNP